jgi:conjugal transfer mating pair stabilization protein TraG
MRYKRKLYKMMMRRVKKYSRYFTRILLKPINIFVFLMAAGVGSLILLNMQEAQKIHTADLLNTIAKVESKHNYNAYFGNSANTSIKFTDMTVNEVLAWQRQFIEQGNASSAVGRYQFIDSTLEGLVRQLKIDGNTKFNEALQDRLAVALLERRGIHEYVNNKISREEFAHSLSKEWAALPKVIGENPEQSYYAGDGLNKAQLGIDEVFASIATVRKL